MSLRFKKMDEAEVWHEDVSCYQVCLFSFSFSLPFLLFLLDLANFSSKVVDKESNKVIGFFYVDLHPREGKYGHAAAFPLQSGCEDGEGKRFFFPSSFILF